VRRYVSSGSPCRQQRPLDRNARYGLCTGRMPDAHLKKKKKRKRKGPSAAPTLVFTRETEATARRCCQRSKAPRGMLLCVASPSRTWPNAARAGAQTPWPWVLHCCRHRSLAAPYIDTPSKAPHSVRPYDSTCCIPRSTTVRHK
jgi:hypothetical protein